MEIKKKKEFKDTKLAYNIRKFIYSYRRWKRYNKAEIKFWKKLNFWILVCLLNVSVGFMLGRAIFRWFWLGEY